MKLVLRILAYIWASPATGLGLLLLPVAWLTGGSARVVRGAIEIEGGWVKRLLRRGLPWVGSGAAMTLGHVILGQDRRCLDKCRDHEHVHVRQYERWGPFMIPAYLACALWLGLRRRDPYLDNPFEREAFGEERPEAGGRKL